MIEKTPMDIYMEQKTPMTTYKEQDQLRLTDAFLLIVKILKKYCDLEERNYSLIAMWILGTYAHKNFISYPYLFINAMKSSGKSRLLKLISILSWNGKMVGSLKEAVLFRTASNSTICIDEFEQIGGPDKATLRELLNSAYKRGTVVERMKKLVISGKESYSVEKFDLFCPVAMANIWGMDDVLGDRCITLILEKSSDIKRTRLIEDFENDKEIAQYLSIVSSESVVSVVKFLPRDTYQAWNSMIIEEKDNHTYFTNNNITLTTLTTLLLKVKDTSLNSRHLELFFPLFLIASQINTALLDLIIRIAETIVTEKKEEELVENRDISFMDFISKKEETLDFISIRELTNEFREFFNDQSGEEEWINTKWTGRALKRLALIREKIRKNNGIKVRVNFSKAREKIAFLNPIAIKEQEIRPEKEQSQTDMEIPSKELVCRRCGLIVSKEDYVEDLQICGFCNEQDEKENEAKIL